VPLARKKHAGRQVQLEDGLKPETFIGRRVGFAHRPRAASGYDEKDSLETNLRLASEYGGLQCSADAEVYFSRHLRGARREGTETPASPSRRPDAPMMRKILSRSNPITGTQPPHPRLGCVRAGHQRRNHLSGSAPRLDVNSELR
jgi:hypothetical protein